MSNLRKEPVIDSQAYTLSHRVRLTWKEVRELAKEKPAPAVPAVEPQAVPVPAPAPAVAAASAPVPTPVIKPALMLSQAQQEALLAELAPAVEAAVRDALSNTIEASLTNAVSRVRADVNRSVTGIVKNALSTELQKIDLNQFLKS